MQKPSLPKGTRDFSSVQIYRREYIFRCIREVFQSYGYHPLETPSMELLQTLTGKYGEEGDMLLFKILNNGDFLAKADAQALTTRSSQQLVPSISKRALRYDLTVPFARYVVMHQHEIQFPFKRYQMQPVWRADRPQKGRYQEFYQCDADVVGSDSLVYEAEFIHIYDKVFSMLGMQVEIRVNNRKILAGIAEKAGLKDQFVAFTIILDKLDKIGMDGVRAEMTEKGIPEQGLELIEKCLQADGDLARLRLLLGDNPMAARGLDEMESVLSLAAQDVLTQKVILDITLARGLNYYTGCIFEVKSTEAEMGSIGGGGRYDNLTGTFGLDGVSGVGISFGAERIYDILEFMQKWPDTIQHRPMLIVLPITENQLTYAFSLTQYLRSQGIDSDLYPETGKFKKGMKYASDRKYHFAVICGEEEANTGSLTLKNMDTGVQSKLTRTEALTLLKSC
jgi:histidyl-tRNA synthetase